MGQKFDELNEKHIDFIRDQKMFFVATAGKESRINLSPKGMGTLRVASNHKVQWLNFTGSGNETAAHLKEMSRMTIMLCAFEGNPLIMRIYGQAKIYHIDDSEFEQILQNFKEDKGEAFESEFGDAAGIRQAIELDIELVQTSCGWGVPLMDFKEERGLLVKWANNKGEEGVKKYWDEKNQISIDGVDIYK